MTLTAGQLVAYLSVQGVDEANRDVKKFQDGLQQTGTTAKDASGKVETVESSLKSSGDEAVKTNGKLRDTSGALIGASSSSSKLTTAQNALDTATRKVADSTAKSSSAQASLAAAQARLAAAEARATALREAGNATAVQTSAAEAKVAAAKAGVVAASNRVAAASAAETLALQGQAAAAAQAAAANVAGAAASDDAAEAVTGVSDGASDASDSIEELAGTASAAGAGILAAFGAAQVMFSNFDAQMSSTGAAISDLADGDLENLRQAALDAGAATFFSATEAAAGEEALAKAGVGVSDIVNGALTGALNLAASGNLDVADSAETAATAMTVFGLSGAQVPHIADVLAAAAGKAQGEVSDMAQALNQSALVANQVGLSFEDTTGALAMFASAGLQGSDAGTSFKTMLLALNPTSNQAAQLMKDLGISAYDQQGRFIGLSKYAQVLHDKLGPLPDDQRQMALSTIFGTDAIRAATIVMDAGAKGVDQWASAVNDSGYAQDQAAAKMDNLKGDVEQLSGAFQTLVLENSSGVNGFLRGFVQHITDDVNAIGKLPPAVGQVGSAVGMGAGAMLLFGGAATLLRGRLDLVATSMMDVATRPGARMTTAMGAASRGVSFLSGNLFKIAGVVGIAAVAFDYWAKKQAETKAQVDSYTEAVKADSFAIGENTRAKVAQTLADDNIYEAAKKLGISQQEVTDAVLGNTDAIAKINHLYEDNRAQLDAWGAAGSTSAGKWKNASDAAAAVHAAVTTQTDSLSEATQAANDYQAAQGGGSEAAQELADKADAASTSLDGATVSMKGQTDAATILKNALDNLSGKDISAQQAQLSLNAAMNGFTDSVKQNGASLTAQQTVMDANGHSYSILTDGATKNQQALIGAIDLVNKHAQAVYDQTGSIDLATAALGTDEAQLRAAAQAAGLNASEVQNLIDKYAATPKEVKTNVYANTDSALANVQELKRWTDMLQDKRVTINYDVVARYSQGLDYYGNPVPTGKARGGLVEGPGTGTSDDVGPFMLSNREFVLTAAAVNKVGVPFLERLNAGADPLQAVGGGGYAGAATTPAAAGRIVHQTNYITAGWEARETDQFLSMQVGVD